MPAVSVVIPVFQRSEYLMEAVRSAEKQDHVNLEIVVADDGSSDSSLDLLLEELSDRPKVRVLRLPHVGVAATRNRAIETSSAKYILPLDDDDLIEPDYVSKAVEVLEERPEVGIVYCLADLFGSVSGPWGLPPFTMKRMLLDNCIFVSAVFRKADWERVGGYSTSMPAREDHDFFLRLLKVGVEPYRLNQVLFHYRQHAASRNQIVALDRTKLIEAHSRMLRENSELYIREAEQLWAAIFELKDEVNNLRNRYALLERWRSRLLPLLNARKRVF